MPNLTHPKIGVAGILARSDGRILVARRAHSPNLGRWAFPGGTLQFQESLADGLSREFFEETGLTVKIETLAWVAEIKDGHNVHYVVLDYVVSAMDENARAASDVDEVRWVGRDDWSELPLADGMMACLMNGHVRKLIGWDGA